MILTQRRRWQQQQQQHRNQQATSSNNISHVRISTRTSTTTREDVPTSACTCRKCSTPGTTRWKWASTSPLGTPPAPGGNRARRSCNKKILKKNSKINTIKSQHNTQHPRWGEKTEVHRLCWRFVFGNWLSRRSWLFTKPNCPPRAKVEKTKKTSWKKSKEMHSIESEQNISIRQICRRYVVSGNLTNHPWPTRLSIAQHLVGTGT